MEKKVYSVGELTANIKYLLENSLPTIWLQGEISNLKNHYSGHLYFSLKDEQAQISAVMWRTRAQSLLFRPEDGQQVRVLGNIRLYEKSGRYQIDIVRMIDAGAGELQRAFEQLKKKLADEGLFDEDRKKQLPEHPKTIAVVTSPTGAAIRDILNVLKRRAPYIRVIVRPAKVQGAGAAQDITRAIQEINKHTDADIMIVGRGGGSLEDLWAFNEEAVARAISASRIPVVSAVGHEIDFSIADFCADLRAPTPSAAAELVSGDAGALKDTLLAMEQRMRRSLLQQIGFYRNRLRAQQQSYGLRRLEDLIYQYQTRVSDLQTRLWALYKQNIHSKRVAVLAMQKNLDSLNPRNILKRGYSISMVNGKVLRDVTQVEKGMTLTTLLANGRIESIADRTIVEKKNGKKNTI